MSTSYPKSNIFMAAKDSPVAPWKRALNYFVVVVAVVAVVGVSLSMAGIALNFDFVVQYRTRIWDGFCLTVFISLFSLVGSLIIGIPVALGQNARFLPVRDLGRIAPDGLAYPSGPHRAICEHHKRLVATFGDRGYRANPDHARDQRHEL